MKQLLLFVCFSMMMPYAFAGGIDETLPSIGTPKPNLHLGLMKDHPSFNTDRQGKALSFGYYEFGSDKLNNYLDTSSSVSGNFDANYMGIGIDNISNNGKHQDIIGGVQFLLPQKVSAGPGDSLRLKLYGWHYTMSILAWDFIPGEMVTLAIGSQVSWGNLKMSREVAGEKTKYKNPFIAPGGRAEFRLTFGNFMIGGRTTYRYDITHALWKRKDDMMPVLPEYKNHGLAYFGYIGLIF